MELRRAQTSGSSKCPFPLHADVLKQSSAPTRGLVADGLGLGGQVSRAAGLELCRLIHEMYARVRQCVGLPRPHDRRVALLGLAGLVPLRQLARPALDPTHRPNDNPTAEYAGATSSCVSSSRTSNGSRQPRRVALTERTPGEDQHRGATSDADAGGRDHHAERLHHIVDAEGSATARRRTGSGL